MNEEVLPIRAPLQRPLATDSWRLVDRMAALTQAVNQTTDAQV